MKRIALTLSILSAIAGCWLTDTAPWSLRGGLLTAALVFGFLSDPEAVLVWILDALGKRPARV